GDLDMYLSNNSINPSDLVIDVKSGIRNKEDGDGGDKLYRNDGKHFTNVNKDAGIYSSIIGFGLGISVADVNRDSWSDIYVANDFFEKDYLYINNGDGTFTESIEELTQELSLGSMGVDIADMNHDGYPEIFVTEMLPASEKRLKTKAIFDNWDKYQLKVKNGYYRQFPRNTFQLNNGLGPNANISFSEISRYANVSATDWSWGVQMVDFDLDGTNEIFVTNGIPKDLLDQDYIDFYADPSKIREILRREGAVIKRLIDDIPTEPVANYIFKQKKYLEFENVAKEWGMNQPGFSSGSTYGDIDNDGDLDLVVNNINAPPFIYRNRTGHEDNHFLVLDLKNENGLPAIGAQVTVTVQGKKHYKELFPMRGVMSVIDSRLNFGLGSEEVIDSIQVHWPNDNTTIRTDIAADQFLSLQMDSSSPLKPDSIQIESQVLLENHNHKLFPNHKHCESAFIDFNNEKLLFEMVSNEGPKVAVGDVNGDGKEDVFVAGAKGQASTLYLQKPNGFSMTDEEIFRNDKRSEDTYAIFFDADGDKDLDLLVATGSPEFSTSSFALMDRLYFNNGHGHFVKSEQLLPDGRPSATSVVVNADFDADGDQDIFFGGRLVPGSYGVPATSYLLENDGQGKFTNATESKIPELSEIGMVTDAAWLDYDVDGDLDLIVVGHWMPIRLFENLGNKFKEVSKNVGFKNSNGFWNTVETNDLDGDGHEDLMVGNLGENTFFKASIGSPVRMYVNDFDQNGDVEQVITSYNGENAYPIVQKKEITAQLPYLLKRYLKYTDYKEQTITDIFSTEQLSTALTYEVFTTNSMVFWNQGGRFISEALPFEAQISPVYGILVDNLDNNDDVDILLAGNQHRAKPQTGIYSASYGTIIQITKNREMKTMDPIVSGLHIKSEVRDIEKLKLKDKEYLLFACNNDSLQIYGINR
ncbi:MAG: VCBS repeat-containing protein, partial [Cytophagales bacterium]|nr:VCBS repeat-containing protein [Cytophagales bacterium]